MQDQILEERTGRCIKKILGRAFKDYEASTNNMVRSSEVFWTSYGLEESFRILQENFGDIPGFKKILEDAYRKYELKCERYKQELKKYRKTFSVPPECIGS